MHFLKSSFIVIYVFFSVVCSGQNEKTLKHHLAGEEALNRALYDEAIGHFDKAIKSDASSVWSYIYRGLAHVHQREYELAISDYDKAISLDKEMAIVYEYRGIAYSQDVDFNEAIEDFTTALKFNPNRVELYNNRGWCYLRIKKYQEAIDDCSKAIELDTNYVMAYASRGWAYYLNEEYEKAQADLKLAMRIDPENEHHKTILDHYTKAVVAVESGLSLAPLAVKSINKPGKFHALIIGNNKYNDPNISSLDQPLKDASKLYDVLTSRYTFHKDDVIFLKNATRGDIIDAMDDMSRKLTDADNLIIFYAGHGYWDEEKESGYWLPVDSRKDKTTNWLRNSTIQGYIDNIPSQHTLLIADACFGGGIFKTRKAFEDAPPSIENLYKLPSRKGMTSGMLNEVPDRSVFMEYLVKRLEQNDEKYLSSLDLFTQFRMAVMNNSRNTPQYGTIHNAGDEGGDFIFVRR